MALDQLGEGGVVRPREIAPGQFTIRELGGQAPRACGGSGAGSGACGGHDGILPNVRRPYLSAAPRARGNTIFGRLGFMRRLLEATEWRVWRRKDEAIS